MSDEHDVINIRDLRVAFIGVGVMGGAILSAFLRGEGADPRKVTIVASRPERVPDQQRRFPGVRVITDAEQAVMDADLIVLGVKPKDVGGVLQDVRDAFVANAEEAVSESVDVRRKILLTVAAGLTTGYYERRLGPVPVVRAMPNTPAQIGYGMTAISAGSHADEDDLAVCRALLENTGDVICVPEKDQDAVSALSGSGPAYVFAVIDAMAEAGVLLGLTRPTAVRLAAQTVLGSGKMAMDGLESEPTVPPSTLREQVTSPGGTTARALYELDKAGVRAAFSSALQAAYARSKELAADD